MPLALVAAIPSVPGWVREMATHVPFPNATLVQLALIGIPYEFQDNPSKLRAIMFEFDKAINLPWLYSMACHPATEGIVPIVQFTPSVLIATELLEYAMAKNFPSPKASLCQYFSGREPKVQFCPPSDDVMTDEGCSEPPFSITTNLPSPNAMSFQLLKEFARLGIYLYERN